MLLVLTNNPMTHARRSTMEVRTESKNGALVASPAETLETFQVQTQSTMEQWIQQLQANPDCFTDVEQQIDQHFRRGGGQLIASILAKVTQTPQLKECIGQVRRNAAIPLRASQPRTLQVRLLCGLVLWLTTAYCAPRRNKATDPGEQLAGLYPELAAFGFGKGCSPALQYKVARIVALSPSIEVARQELRREGIVLNKKTVRRMAEQLGQQLLELRRRELYAWREGWLPAGNDFAGRRVAVQIDGGRVRLRENKKRKKNGKKKKGSRRKFDTPWREPKALIIFEFNEQGNMIKKDRQPLIDGTLLGPDHLAELVAFHLHRLGVAQAEMVVFISDGARWIWDRLEWIEKRAGLDRTKTLHVLDFCHAAHHIGLALSHLGYASAVRRKRYVELRRLLYCSRYDEVVSKLTDRAKQQQLAENHEVWTEIRYLERHGSEGHLRYATFRRRGVPCGSGAIESTIRRVINLRLKSNATYWLGENAEGVFVIRALLLCDRWDETLSRVRHTMAGDRRIAWQWDAPDLTKLNADEPVLPPSPRTQEKPPLTALAS
jgi:hypothetical protein